MLLKKRVDYGFGGYQFPAVPRGPRSVRKRGRHKKLLEDNQLCPFELLATVAGELLQEKESSASSNAEERKEDGFKPEQFKVSKLQGSCVESTFIPEYAAGDSISDCIFKEIPLTPIISKDVNNDKKELTNLGNMYNVSNVKKDDIAVKRCSLKDTTGECVNNSVQFPFHRNPIPSVSFTKHMNNVNLGLVRDDDEKLFGCSSTKFKAFRPLPQSQSRFGYRRIRKIITSKYWKVAPNYERMNPFYRNRKSWYTRELPCKRRKFVIARDQEASNRIIKNSPKKGDNNTSVKSFQKSRDANVKFRIKSFKVPELYIEVPETATVGALKRSVMEAWSGIVEGGLRVGVVHKGKRVRDDKRTLQQAGISESSNLEALGFALEPRCLNQISPRSISDTSFGPIPTTKMDGKDLVVVRTSNVHRRIRRPFSVGEVEALVEAVETLGTGRWRDVKVRAFDIADHRTYVDLKDKWKTLVHTATISPQQRRGEPVPQELLDRVLSAHSYWSQPSSLNCLNN